MNINILKEKLEKNPCHIHKQLPITTLSENGDLRIKTCCILFEKQLNLLVDQQYEKNCYITSI
jgi:hypothetical protein